MAGVLGGAALGSAWALAGGGIVNGTFGDHLDGWKTVVVSHGSEAEYPEFTQDKSESCYLSETVNPFASVDVPEGADGYIEQEITVPSGHPHLTLLTWGNLTAVTATIGVVTADGTLHVLDTYTPAQLQSSVGSCSGKKPVWLSLNLAPYAGQQVQLRLGATSRGFDGTIVNFDDVSFTGQRPAGSTATAAASTGAPTGVLGASQTSSVAATSPRSTIASSLVPIDHAFPLNWRTAVDVAITLAAMVLITFPAQLFNRTLDENYDDIRDIARARAPVLVSARRALRRWGDASGRNAFLAVMVIGSLLGGLNDPTFGFNVKSIETFVAVICTFSVGVAYSSRIGWEHRRRIHLDTKWHWHARPAGLVVAAACMIVSRITNFEPGYLYGVIAGVSFSAALDRRQQGRDVALSALGTLVLAVASWAVWTPIASAAAKPHPVFILVIADTFFAGLFVSGVVGTVINLMPLEFLPGAALARWHKGAWAAVTAVAVFLLVEVMLLPAAASARHGDAPVVTTLVLFGVFGVLSIAFHRYFARRREAKTAGTVMGSSVERAGRGAPVAAGAPGATAEGRGTAGGGGAGREEPATSPSVRGAADVGDLQEHGPSIVSPHDG